MPAPLAISPDKVARLIGTARAPVILDVRSNEDFAADLLLLPRDTARFDLAPEAAGLPAASLGLSRMHADDLEQWEARMGLYDAFWLWARDALRPRPPTGPVPRRELRCERCGNIL